MILQRISLIATTLIFLVGIGFTHHYSQSVREQWSDAAVDLWLIPSMEEAIEGHWVKSDTGTLLHSAVKALRSTLATHQQQLSPDQDWIDSLQVDYVGEHQFTTERMSRHIDRRLVIDGEDVNLGLSMAIPYGLPWATVLAFLAGYGGLIVVGLTLWPKPYDDWELARLKEGASPGTLRECNKLKVNYSDAFDPDVFVEARNAGVSREDATSISLNNARLFRELRASTWSCSAASQYILDGGTALTEEQAGWFRFVSDIHGLPHQQAVDAARKHTDIEFDRPNCCVTLGGLKVTMGPLPLAVYELINKAGQKSNTAVIRPSDDVPDKELGARVATLYQRYKGYRENTRTKLEAEGMEANPLNQHISNANSAIAKVVSDEDFFNRYFEITTISIDGRRSSYAVGAADYNLPSGN